MSHSRSKGKSRRNEQEDINDDDRFSFVAEHNNNNNSSMSAFTEFSQSSMRVDAQDYGDDVDHDNNSDGGGVQGQDSINDEDEDFCESNIMRILVATDNHVGAMERDRVRRDDSFIAFEEILATAKAKNVDFILHGGDLFHDNKPSRETLHRTLELFRKYCCGDRPVPLKIHSDQKVNFKHNFGTVNYEDPNFNIAMPVFGIHGNHDDPTGENGLSALDLLSVSNLINYFGKSDSIDDIKVHPILISKGKTKLALYGLGHIRDERLYRTFQQKKVKFFRPKDHKDDWFNIFVLHQNRNQHHTRKSTISESMLRGFFDIVIWGHEHEQKVKPEKSVEGNFDVMQPGSSVVTSLAREESKQKKIAMIEVYKDKYRCTEIPLQTVRPFVMDDIVLSEYEHLERDKNNVDEIMQVLCNKVEEMIKKAEKKSPSQEVLARHPMLNLPLIRLRVDYSGGFATVNPQRFGQNFIGRVANPADMIIFSRSRAKTLKDNTNKTSRNDAALDIRELMRGDFAAEEDNVGDSGGAASIEDFISKVLRSESAKLSILNELTLRDALNDFVQKEEPHAIKDFVEKQLKSTQKQLWRDTKAYLESNPQQSIDEDDISELLQQYSEKEREQMELDDAANRRSRRNRANEDDGNDEMNIDEDDMPASPVRQRNDDSDEESLEEEQPPPKRSRGKAVATSRGRGRGRGASSSRSKTAIKFKPLDLDNDEEDDNDFVSDGDEEVQPSTSRRTTRATSSSSRKRTRDTNDDDDEFEMEEIDSKQSVAKRPRRAPPRRATRATSTIIDLDNDDVDDDDDENDDGGSSILATTTVAKKWGSSSSTTTTRTRRR